MNLSERRFIPRDPRISALIPTAVLLPDDREIMAQGRPAARPKRSRKHIDQ